MTPRVDWHHSQAARTNTLGDMLVPRFRPIGRLGGHMRKPQNWRCNEKTFCKMTCWVEWYHSGAATTNTLGASLVPRFRPMGELGGHVRKPQNWRCIEKTFCKMTPRVDWYHLRSNPSSTLGAMPIPRFRPMDRLRGHFQKLHIWRSNQKTFWRMTPRVDWYHSSSAWSNTLGAMPVPKFGLGPTTRNLGMRLAPKLFVVLTWERSQSTRKVILHNVFWLNPQISSSFKRLPTPPMVHKWRFRSSS